MTQQLPMTLGVPRVKFRNLFSGIYHSTAIESVTGRTSLLMFFLLFTLTGYGQLATETFESGIPASGLRLIIAWIPPHGLFPRMVI